MGSTSLPTDEQGRAKVQCQICKKWYHRLDVHISRAHGTSARQYQARFPDFPLLSEAGELAARKSKAAEPPAPETEATTFKLGWATLYKVDEAEYEDEDLALIPIHDEHWEMGPQEAERLQELALGIQEDDNVLIVGPHGCGKSKIAMELAALVGQPLDYFPMTGDVRVADFLGDKNIVVDPETKQTITDWRDGALPRSITRGRWMLVDEFDACPPHISFVMHGVLERPRRLTLLSDGGRVVKVDPRFRFIATANTLGQGDDSGLYAGTNVLNAALLDRFGMVIRMDYPARETEIKIVSRFCGEHHAEKMVAFARKVREQQAAEACYASVSTRRLVDWAKKVRIMGDPRKAATLSILNKLGRDDRVVVDGLMGRML